MRRGIDQPIERVVEPPVDIQRRLAEVRQSVEIAREELAKLESSATNDEMPRVRAKERYRHGLLVLNYWERKSEQQVFEAEVENYAFLIVAGLVLRAVEQNKNPEASLG